MDSILNSVKKFLGISPEDTSFDDNIIICINSVFTSLSQICEGLPKNFNITAAVRRAARSIADRRYQRAQKLNRTSEPHL